MKLFRFACAVLTLAGAVIVPVCALANPIQIQQCFITQPKALSHNASGTQIVYMNKGPKTAVAVTFAVGYRNAANHFARRVVDDGVFAPNAVINHHFDLYKDVTYAGKAVQFCWPVAVKWRDGTSWIAP